MTTCTFSRVSTTGIMSAFGVLGFSARLKSGTLPMSERKRILYLVRHAKSSWDDPSLGDRERPLNRRGEKNAPDMGRRMREQGHVPDLIISSPANRALTTARVIAHEVGLDPEQIRVEDDLYFSGTRGMLGVLDQVDPRYRRVMMTGHNPVMTMLLNELSNAQVYNMPTCAVAIIGFDMDNWSDVYTTDGELLGYDYPKGSGRFTTEI
jgi:phosphohistidine phosphatase